MKLSLVIPVHNLERFIEPLLVSLKIQNYDHDEIEPIFICDCCEDRTHQIIEDYLKNEYKAMKIIDRQHHSSGLSRNDGIELATGEYIWLLDGDDWIIDNHAFSKIINYFNENPESKVLHLSWSTNTFHLPKYILTVWQWVVAAEYAKDTKFTARPYDDDVEWVQNLMSKYDFLKYATVISPLYFYNYMREGSVMEERIKGNGKNNTGSNQK